MRMRRKRRERILRFLAWVAMGMAAGAAFIVLLLVSDGPAESEVPEQRYYISDNYYYTNYEDYLQAVMEREEYQKAEARAAAEEAERIRKAQEEYEERCRSEVEEAFRQMQEEYRGIPEKYDDIPLLWNMVEAEAGNQDLVGKMLVACVALNRVDSPDWPDTLTGVITQPYQFSSYWDGGMEKFSEISDSTKEAVARELDQRSYPALIYFTAGQYSKYGTPYFKHGDHYFSTE